MMMMSVALSGCSSLNAAFQPPTPAPFVATATPPRPTLAVQRGDITRTASYSASVVSKSQTVLQFKAAGQVEKILLQPGDMVKQGDLVAQLQANVSDFDLRRAQISLDKATLLYQQALLTTLKTQKDYEEVIALKKMDVDQAQVSLDELKSKLEATKLIASTAGEVTRVMINVGDTVAAYKTVVVLEDPVQLEVSASFPAADFYRLTENMPVSISLANNPAVVFPGKISPLVYTAIPASAAGNVAVRIAFDGAPPAGVKLGAPLKVQLEIEKKTGVLWLSPAILQGAASAPFVQVQDGTKVVKVNVQVGLSTDERVEIVQGLSEGQKVIIP